jgi:hypothetical protein
MLIIQNHSSDKGIAGRTRNDGGGGGTDFRTILRENTKNVKIIFNSQFSILN